MKSDEPGSNTYIYHRKYVFGSLWCSFSLMQDRLHRLGSKLMNMKVLTKNELYICQMKLPRTPNRLPTYKDMPEDEAGNKGLLFHAREPSERVRNSHMPLHEISTLSMSFTQEATISRISQTSSINQHKPTGSPVTGREH